MGWKGPLSPPHPTPGYRQGHLPPDQVAHSPIQPGIECLQGGGIHSLWATCASEPSNNDTNPTSPSHSTAGINVTWKSKASKRITATSYTKVRKKMHWSTPEGRSQSKDFTKPTTFMAARQALQPNRHSDASASRPPSGSFPRQAGSRCREQHLPVLVLLCSKLASLLQPGAFAPDSSQTHKQHFPGLIQDSQPLSSPLIATAKQLSPLPQTQQKLRQDC